MTFECKSHSSIPVEKMHRIATALFRINFVTILVLSLAHNGWSYKPVMLLHGVHAGPDSMHVLQQQIELHHSGTKICNCDQFTNWNSLESAWRQVKNMGDMLMEIAKGHPEGIHFIGHSQGGLLVLASIFPSPTIGMDPHKQQLYYKSSNFLPFINNEIDSTNSTTFIASLLKLQKLVLIGGPDDGVITPWLAIKEFLAFFICYAKIPLR